MLGGYRIAGDTLDSLDLKFLMLTGGIHVADNVYGAYGASHRISPDPRSCNCVFLPDRTAVHIAELGPTAPFQLTVGQEGRLHLLHRGEFVAEVTLPRATGFYEQKTSRGIPYGQLAVLEGYDMMAFPYLWPCQYTTPGMACKFCHCGNRTEQERAEDANWRAGQDTGLRPQDVAEAIDFGVRAEGTVRHIEVTGGSTFGSNGECAQLAEVLEAVAKTVGIENILGEINVYTTPPRDPGAIDALFAAGAGRVSCNLEVWDEELARQFTPGKARWTGRKRHVDTLLHIARTEGPGKACCTFVAGLEPVESLLEGAQYLASSGVVPLVSVLMTRGLPDFPRVVDPNLEYFRSVKRGLAEIYSANACAPPGAAGGSHVSVSCDVWEHREEILAEATAC